MLKLTYVINEFQSTKEADPIILILSSWQVVLAASFIELIGAVWIWLRRRQDDSLWCILWLCSIFLTYQIGMMLIKYDGACPCLGSYTRILSGEGIPVRALMIGFDVVAIVLVVILLNKATHSQLRFDRLCKFIGSLKTPRAGHKNTLIVYLIVCTAVLTAITTQATIAPLIIEAKTTVLTQTAQADYEPLKLVICTSNNWWRIITQPSDGSMSADYLKIEDGIRVTVAPLQRMINGTNVLPSSSVYPIAYPPPISIGVFLSWLTRCTHSELPILKSNMIRRFLSLEHHDDDRNQGYFKLEFMPDKLLIKQLEIYNDGNAFTPDGRIFKIGQPYSNGHLELRYAVTKTTNFAGFEIPYEAQLELFSAKYGSNDSEDLTVTYLEKYQLTSIQHLNSTSYSLLPKPEPLAVAIDQRFAGFLKRNSAVVHLVTNDNWLSATNAKLRYLAAIKDNQFRNSNIRSLNMLLMIILGVLLSAPIVFGFLSKRKKNQIRRA